MRKLWWLIFTLTLAGCVGTSTEGPGEGPGAGRQDPAGMAGVESAAVGPPAWAIGDHWSYELGGQVISWIVTEDTGDGWVVDTDDEDLAFHHAAFEEVSTLGSVSKELEGSQGEDRVRFFDWPLLDGKQWDLRWDGEDLRATLEDQGDGVWRVQAARDGAVLREYVYDESVGWFRSLQATDADGTLLWQAELMGSGHGYQGEYVRWDVYGVLDVEIDGAGASGIEIGVPQNATDVWYSLDLWCDPDGPEEEQGVMSLIMVSSDDQAQTFTKEAVCPDPDDLHGTLDPSAGSWTGSIQSWGISVSGAFVPRGLQTFSL